MNEIRYRRTLLNSPPAQFQINSSPGAHLVVSGTLTLSGGDLEVSRSPESPFG